MNNAEWYILHTYSGQEDKVQENLKQKAKNQGYSDKIIDVVVPKKDEIEIGFFDTGLPAVPENITHRNLDDIKPGGLGTYFIKEIMDGAVFKKDQKGWVNHLVLTKKI